MRTDIAVVGSGLAALLATRAAQQAGRDVVLVWPGLSSLYFLYATVDVLGYASATDTSPVENPSRAVATLIADNPGHPYAKAGMRALEDGVTQFLHWVKEAGLHWQGSLMRNLLLPTATGAAKPSCLVPATMAAGDLERGGSIVLCGFDGYQDFMPELAASNLSRVLHSGGSVRAVRIALPGFQPDRLFTSVDVARQFEDASFRKEVAERMRSNVGSTTDGTRVGVPAVLGLTSGGKVHAELEAMLGLPVFEIPTLPPSVLGLRVFDRLRKHLQESGIELISSAPAHAADLTGRRCRSIRIKAAGREQPIEARAFVFAIDDVADGALRAGVHSLLDPFFHRTLARHAMPMERTNDSLFKPQPFAQLGYAVNDRLQAVDERGEPLATNVFIAGGAIAGADPAGTKSRGGLAIATGFRAAQEAMAA